MVLYVGDLLYTSHSFKNNFIIYGSIFGCAGCSLLHGHALAATSQASPSSGLSCGAWALGSGAFGSCITWSQQLQPLGLRAQAQ